MTQSGPIRRRLVGGSIQVLLAEALSFPSGILVAAYLTRRLGPSGYGLFALAASLVATIEWFIGSMLSRATIKLTAEADEWRGISVSILRRHLLVGFGLGAATWAAAGQIGLWLDTPELPPLVRLAATQIPIVAFTAAVLNILVGRGRYRPRAVARAARWVSRLGFTVVLVGLGFGIEGALVAMICAVATSLAIALWSLRLHPFERSARVDGFWRLAFAVFTMVASVRLLEKVGLVMLKAFGGTVADAGFYAAAQNFTLGPGLFAMSTSPLLLSALAQARRDHNHQLTRVLCRDALRGIAWLLPLAGIAAGAASELVTLVYGPQFVDAAPLARLLVFSGVALAGLSVTGAILTAIDRPNLALAATGPVLPLAVVGYALVVPAWGSVGAAAVTTISSAVGLAGTLVLVHRLLGAAPPMATVARAVLVTVFCWAVSAWWPTPGLLVLVKVAVVGSAALLLVAFLGEFTPGEMNLLRTLLPWAQRDGRHHRLEGPPVEYLDEFMAAQKRDANLGLVNRWVELPATARVLKTDLFDESRPGEGFLDRLGTYQRLLVGMDISPAIVGLGLKRMASERAGGVVADVRRLPFATGVFDLVISNSTLDHFDSTVEIDRALAELSRVTRQGGVVVVTLDNPHNITYPLLRLAAAAGMTPFPLGETYDRRDLGRALARVGLVVTDHRAVIHNPRLLPTAALLIARRLRWTQLQRGVHWMQRSFERCEGTRWQYLTGCFIAARAVKEGVPPERGQRDGDAGQRA